MGRWDGRERFFPEGFNVGGHLYAPIRQKAPFGPIYRLFIAINHLEWVPYSVHLLLEWCWLAMASQTWCADAKVVWRSNLAFGRFDRFGRDFAHGATLNADRLTRAFGGWTEGVLWSGHSKCVRSPKKWGFWVAKTESQRCREKR